MILNDYELIIKGKTLLQNVNIEFYSGQLNHVLGKNGVGKSKMAQNLYQNQEKYGLSIGLISTCTNIPMDITMNDLISLLEKKYPNDKIDDLTNMLNLDNVNFQLKIKSLSDGQKQKIKLLVFLMIDYDVLILDEITNALDKKTTNDIYNFLSQYVQRYPQKCIINITHNLSDLSQMNGAYFLIEDNTIKEYKTKEEIISKYIKGE